MHPAISLFPNREFYENKITDGRNVKEAMYEKRFLKGNIFGSYSFINISNGNEQYDNKHSTRNMSEDYVISEIVANLHKGNMYYLSSTSSMLVMTFSCFQYCISINMAIVLENLISFLNYRVCYFKEKGFRRLYISLQSSSF